MGNCKCACGNSSHFLNSVQANFCVDSNILPLARL